MAAIRSSVRPAQVKQPWGTILKPEFGMGFQKLTGYEIEQTVNRLYKVPVPKERPYTRTGKTLDTSEIQEMLDRLTSVKRGVTDSDRRVKISSYGIMGVVSSYAWQGYN